MRGRTGVRQLVPSAVATFIVTAVLAACASDGASSEPVSAPDAVTTTTAALAAPPSTSTSTTSTSTTTTSSSTTTTTIAIPDSPGPLDFDAAVVGLGRSVEGRPIVAERFGTPGGRRVLVIGVIHGDEDAGTRDPRRPALRTRPGRRRAVAGRLDEPRRPGRAGPPERERRRSQPQLPRTSGVRSGCPATVQYAGTGPASEPETQAIVNLSTSSRPDIAIWYHQDLFVISPAKGREGRIRQRYAELTGLPMGGISGGTYTGIAATWARHELADQRSCGLHRRTRARRCRPRMPHCTPTPSAPSASKAETPGVRHRAFHVQTKRANTSSGSRSETSELIGLSRSACPIATPQKIRCSSGAPTNSLTAASCTAQASCGHVSRPAS